MSNLPKWIATPFLGIEFDNSVSEEFNTNIPRYFPSLNTQIDTLKTI